MKIGILGGGQLARMIIEGCYKYGFEFYVLSKEADSPAGQVTRNELVGDWNDEECLKKFASMCDIITLENEFIDVNKIKYLEGLGKQVYPASKAIELIQDKLYQKKTLKENNIPVAGFCEVDSKEDIVNFAKKNSYPVILKSRTMGYDGKGNYLVRSEADVDDAFDTLIKRGSLMCESFVNFDREIATQVVRNKSGEIRIYPVVETVQKDQVCHLVIASDGMFDNIKTKVEQMAKTIVEKLDYVGVMGIEMFLIGEEILINELAPRVHNSGHYTIEGCYTSQFENHLRAVMNFPLGDINLRDNSCVMINIIGERNSRAKLSNTGAVLSEDKAYLHIYGKQETKTGRKMGHITVLNEDREAAVRIAKDLRKKINI
ncbi:MAG: 5-(carboxyamino)imidazole ribonucleotide synthase [bacterium]|nr:5-(carboxyamino)imidazole ribonucleotide synthase [bacterium]